MTTYRKADGLREEVQRSRNRMLVSHDEHEHKKTCLYSSRFNVCLRKV